MENRRTPSYPPDQSPNIQLQSKGAYMGKKSLESYSSPARQFRQGPDHPHRAEDFSKPRQPDHIKRSAQLPVTQASHTAGTCHGQNKFPRPPHATSPYPGAYTSRHTQNDNGACFNTSLSTQSGSQFAPKEYTPPTPSLKSPSYLNAEAHGTQSLFTDPWESRSSPLSPYAATTLPQGGRPLSEKALAYDSNTCMAISPATTTFSTPEPWAHVRPNNSFEFRDRQRAMSGPVGLYPKDNKADCSNKFLTPTVASPYSQQKVKNFPQDELHSGRLGSADNLKTLQYNVSSEGGVDESAFRHIYPPTSSAPMHYIQGRRRALEVPIHHSVEHISSSTGSGTLSRHGVSQNTRSSHDSSDPQPRSLESRKRRSSTRTSTTTTTTTSHGRRSSNSARRYQDIPDPLPCSDCPEGTSFSGHDRLTNRQRHNREVHQNFKVPCPDCNKGFSRRENLKRHIMTLHPHSRE